MHQLRQILTLSVVDACVKWLGAIELPLREAVKQKNNIRYASLRGRWFFSHGVPLDFGQDQGCQHSSNEVVHWGYGAYYI